MGIAEFTPSQIADLETIAAYCPSEGGAAVHQARGMLSMFQDVNMLDFDCNSSHAKKAQGNTNALNTLIEWDILLYPNPAKDQVTIQSNVELGKGTTLEIYNLLGQLVKTETLTNETTSIDININAFIDGIYIVRLQKDNQTLSKSFVVTN